MGVAIRLDLRASGLWIGPVWPREVEEDSQLSPEGSSMGELGVGRDQVPLASALTPGLCSETWEEQREALLSLTNAPWFFSVPQI